MDILLLSWSNILLQNQENLQIFKNLVNKGIMYTVDVADKTNFVRTSTQCTYEFKLTTSLLTITFVVDFHCGFNDVIAKGVLDCENRTVVIK